MKKQNIWESFEETLYDRLVFEINDKIQALNFLSNSTSHPTQNQDEKAIAYDEAMLLKDLYTFHQYNQNLDSLLKIKKIAQEFQSVWYYYCIPIPLYWNGFAKGKAIENALNTLSNEEKLNFNLDNTQDLKAQQIKKILASPRWVWEFKIEEDASKNLTNSIKKFF